jgi:hypothetical protein
LRSPAEHGLDGTNLSYVNSTCDQPVQLELSLE